MSLVLAVLLPALQAEDETTAGFRGWRPREGHKAVLKSEDVQSVWMKLSRGEAARPLKIEKAKAFAATQEILEAEGRVPTRVRRVFSKASARTNLRETPFGFQGAAVVYAYDPDGPRRLAREDGRLLSFEESAALRAAFFDGELDRPDRGAGDDENPLWPRTPLKPGESAELPVEGAARLLGGSDFRDWIDPKISTLKVTFKGAETRAGARFAKLRYAGVFLLRRYGEHALEDPVPARITYETDACVDGSRPDVAFSIAIEIKGSAGTPLPDGARGTLELDIRGDLAFSLRSITEE